MVNKMRKDNIDVKDIDLKKERIKKKIKRRKLFNILFDIVLIGIILFCAYKIGMWAYDNYKSSKVKDSYKNIQEKIDDTNINKITEETISISELKKQNEDTVAWLKIKNTSISYPIVKSTDNDFYINHSFDKSYNSAGWLFMDYKNKMDGTDKNIVIYGHNRRNGDMFGTLDKTLKEEWYTNKDNKNIILITEKGVEKYEVYSVYEVLNEEYYINTNFTDESYNDFISVVSKRSIYNFDTNVDSSRPTLTLSTCSNNDKYRTVLHAIKKTD